MVQAAACYAAWCGFKSRPTLHYGEDALRLGTVFSRRHESVSGCAPRPPFAGDTTYFLQAKKVRLLPSPPSMDTMLDWTGAGLRSQS